MKKQVESIATGSDLPFGRRSPPPPTPAKSPTSSEAGAAGPVAEQDIRLTIEPAADGAGFVYRITDRVSGLVIAELPREAVQAAGESEDYSSGDIVNTRA
jgi:hypothetical protein